MRVFAALTISVVLSVQVAFAGRAEADTATVEGTVITLAASGQKAVVAGAAVLLTGHSVSFRSQTDAAGAYAFPVVPAGAYTIKATAPDMEGQKTILVAPGQVLVAQIQIHVTTVATTVQVTASAQAKPASEPSETTTISEATVNNAPNTNERFQSLLPLVPGVVRGPGGVIHLNGTRASQSGHLINSANATDPATGQEDVNIPIDVVSAVQVLSNPYDPEYSNFAGSVATAETRTSNYEKFHLSAQNFVPRPRVRGGHVVGIGAFTPRFTLTGPILRDRLAFTQSFEYRFKRTPVNSLPPLERDTTLESVNSYSQLDLNLSQHQTATVSFAIFPQKLRYFGLNTFTPQPSTPDLHQRGNLFSAQHRYLTDGGDLLVSQVDYQRFDADVTANNEQPYQLLVETTQGGFFNRQHRRTSRWEWQEVLHSRPLQFHGSHQLNFGVDFAHQNLNAGETFLPVHILGRLGLPLESITFGPSSAFDIKQDSEGWFAGDQWSPVTRLSFDVGVRGDWDSITGSTNTAPRAGFILALTSDGKTLLKGGAGLFYDRVPLNIPAFPSLPYRTVSQSDSSGRVTSLTTYANVISQLRNPRSEAWNLELDRQLIHNLTLRLGYQQRNTVHDLFVSPLLSGAHSTLSLADSGRSFYREFQITTAYRIHHDVINASYVRSKAVGDLNDYNQFFGNDPQPVIQSNVRAQLPFDAPNRFLIWGQFAAPWKLTVVPVFEVHTGFPYSLMNDAREFVGRRDAYRFPAFSSLDLQVLKEVGFHLFGKEHKAKVGMSVFNLLNRSDPREVQNIVESYRFGSFFNPLHRTFRGKFILEF